MITVQYPEVSTPNIVGSQEEDPTQNNFINNGVANVVCRSCSYFTVLTGSLTYNSYYPPLLYNDIEYIYSTQFGECTVSPIVYTDDQSVVKTAITDVISFAEIFNEPFQNSLLKEGLCSQDGTSPAHAVLNVKRIDNWFATIKFDMEITGYRLEVRPSTGLDISWGEVRYKTLDSSVIVENIQDEEWLSVEPDPEYRWLRWHNLSDNTAENYEYVGNHRFQPAIFRAENAGATFYHDEPSSVGFTDKNWELYK